MAGGGLSVLSKAKKITAATKAVASVGVNAGGSVTSQLLTEGTVDPVQTFTSIYIGSQSQHVAKPLQELTDSQLGKEVIGKVVNKGVGKLTGQ